MADCRIWPSTQAKQSRIRIWESHLRHQLTFSSRQAARLVKTPPEIYWQHRFGVSHGIWAARDDVGLLEVVASIADPALDRVMSGIPTTRQSGLGPWKIVRNREAFPSAWIAAPGS